MVAIFDVYTYYLRMNFPIFIQHRSLHLHPSMGSSKKSCLSCLVLCLSHWSFSKILTIKIHPQSFLVSLYQLYFGFLQHAGVKQSCTFYFPYDPGWLILDNKFSLNLITSAETLTFLDQSDIWFYRAVKTSKGFFWDNKFFLQFRTLLVDWMYYFVVIPSHL